MSNLFGIALDQAWLRWAAAEGVTETVIAAVSLLHERSVDLGTSPCSLAAAQAAIHPERMMHLRPGEL